MDKFLEEINKHEDKEYIASIDDDTDLLLEIENRYNLTYINCLSFLIKNNYTPILLQNFLQHNYKIPIFQNSVILENNSNDSNESFKLVLSRLPFELIIAEVDNYSDYLIEQSSDIYEEMIINKVCGFYLDVLINKNDMALTLYDYITPFIIENDKIKIIKKNDILKYWIFYKTEISSRNTIFKMIFISGNTSTVTNSIINSLIETLNLRNETFDSLKEKFENNNILINNQNREKFFTSYLTTLNFNENSIVKLNYNLYFTLDIKKQHEYHVNIILENLKMLEALVSETIVEINERRESYKFRIYNDEIYMKTIKIFKRYNPDVIYFRIEKKYNFLFYFICRCNNIPFGSDLLMLKKNTILQESLCIQHLQTFEKKVISIINNFFKFNFKNTYVKKNNLLKNGK